MQDDIPAAKMVDNMILRGDLVVTEKCPACGARFAFPTDDVLTCVDCHTEFKP